MNTTLQIRVDSGVKEKAKKVFEELGIDVSSGIKLFLSQVVNTGSIPFCPITKNGFTDSYEKKILKETESVLKSNKSFNTAQDLHRALLK